MPTEGIVGQRCWLQTRSGLQFDLLDPKFESIRINDIAHSLSLICRFNGHCNKFFSVAEHSINCATYAWHSDPSTSPRTLLFILLHDAREAYIGDIISPVKRLAHPRSYTVQLEKIIARCVYEALVEAQPDPVECRLIHKMDKDMLITEVSKLMRNWESWPDASLYKPVSEFNLSCWTPDEAKKKFLHFFYWLKQRRTTELSEIKE